MRRMNKTAIRSLSIVVFLAFAFAFDYFTVAAVFEVGFSGATRVLLAMICLVVGTMAAYLLTSTLIRGFPRHGS
jgi:hypothetical protein